MRATPSPRVTAYAVLAAVFLLAALGLRLARAPEIRVQVDVERATALENDELDVELVVSSEVPVERLELVLVVADGLEVVSGASAQSFRLGWEDERTLELKLRCARWGNYEIGDVRLRARDRLGLTVWESRVDRKQRLRVYPLPETLRRIVRPVSTQLYTGNTEEWMCWSFAKATLVQKGWDLSMQKWDFRTGATEVALLPKQDFDALTVAPGDGYITDTDDAHVFEDWYVYDTDLHVLYPADVVYVLHTADGAYWKMQITTYYPPSGDKKQPHWPAWKWAAVAPPAK